MAPQIYQTEQIARPVYYDRQPVPAFASYSAGLGPHGFTVRATYSPAYPYAAFIENCYVSVQRTGAAAAVFRAYTSILFTSFLGPSGFMGLSSITDNVVNHWEHFNQSDVGYMAYGDMIQIGTENGDTGGVVAFNGTIKGTEFLY